MQNTNFTYSNPLINFMIKPKNGFYRHLLLVLCFAIVALNVSFLTYWEDIGQLKGVAITNSLGLLIIYLGIIYLNIYVLVPRFLLKNRYVLYAIALLLLIIFLIMAELVTENLVRQYFHIHSGKFSLLNNSSIFLLEIVSTCFLYAICFAGSSVTVLLRHWFASGRRMNELEKATIQTELEHLKSQVNPNFLFSVLEKAGILTKQTPERASQMLMKLSKVLRYQLYDSTRNNVLLNAEIIFLEDFLNVEKDRRNGNDFIFKIIQKGHINRTLVPPLLLVPFVIYSISRIGENEKDGFLNLSFSVENGQLDFICEGSKSEQPDDKTCLKDVRRRLELLYDNAYTLMLTESEATHHIHLHLNL